MIDHSFMQRMSLLEVHMHGCTHQRGPGVVGPEHAVETEGELQPIADMPEGQLAYLITLRYRITNAESGEDVASGAVGYIAAYGVSDGPVLTEEQIELFGNSGALFQVHPYIREHVATMCQRSGLTPYVLPMILHDIGAAESGDVDGA